VVVLFFIFYFFWGKSKSKNPFDNPEKTQTITSVIALFFGTAAAIGSAVATLQVASFGLEISKQQEKQNRTTYIESKTNHAISLYADVLVALSDVYTSGVSVDLGIPKIKKNFVLEKMGGELPKNLEIEVSLLTSSLKKLVVALHNLSKDEFAVYCLLEKGKHFKGKLQHLNKKTIENGLPKSMNDVHILFLSDIAAFLDIAQRRLATKTYSELIQARLFANATETDFFGVHYDNRNVRTFFFLGNLIFNVTPDGPPSSDNLFIASYGSAIMHDLFKIIPNGDFIESCAKSHYKEIIGESEVPYIFRSNDYHFEKLTDGN